MKKLISVFVIFMTTTVGYPQVWESQDTHNSILTTNNQEWTSAQKDGFTIYVKYGVQDSVSWFKQYNFLYNIRISSINILEDKIFLLGCVDLTYTSDAYVLCLDKQTGNLLWSERYHYPLKQYIHSVEKTSTGYIFGGSSYDQYFGFLEGKSLHLYTDTLGNTSNAKFLDIDQWSSSHFTYDGWSVGIVFDISSFYTNGIQDICIQKDTLVRTINLGMSEWPLVTKYHNNKLYVGGKTDEYGFLAVYDILLDSVKVAKFNYYVRDIVVQDSIFLVGENQTNTYLLKIDTLFQNWNEYEFNFISKDSKIGNNNIVFCNQNMYLVKNQLCADIRLYNATVRRYKMGSLHVDEDYDMMGQSFINATITSQSTNFSIVCNSFGGGNNDVSTYKDEELPIREKYQVYNSNGQFMMEGIQQNGEYIILPKEYKGLFLIKKDNNFWEKRIQI